MTVEVWLAGNTLSYVEGAGQLWIHLNWALSLIDAGCRVTWIELVEDDADPHATALAAAGLAERLNTFGLADRLRILGRSSTGAYVIDRNAAREQLAEADLLVSLCYWFPSDLVRAAPRSALVDIDPGLLQIWMANGDIVVAPHDREVDIAIQQRFAIGRERFRLDRNQPDQRTLGGKLSDKGGEKFLAVGSDRPGPH